MSRQFFVSLCPQCKQANQVLVNQMGTIVLCQTCGQGFTSLSVDSHSAALDSSMHYWSRYTRGENESPTSSASDAVLRLPK